MVLVVNASNSSATFCSKFSKYLTAFELNLPNSLGFAALGKVEARLYCETALQNFLALGGDVGLPLNVLMSINYVTSGTDHTEVHVSELALHESLTEAFFAANVRGV